MRNLLKIFFTLIIFFIIFNVGSYSEVVNKVEVKGNERISVETIVVFGDIESGKNYEASDINLLIKKLYETNFFSNISINLQNGILNIEVEENPIINNIAFKGEATKKNKSLLIN